jgi:ornithine decarboxylase
VYQHGLWRGRPQGCGRKGTVAAAMSEKIFRFLEEHRPETPCLVVDLEIVEHNFHVMRKALPDAAIYYAMKANPAPEIMQLLHGLGTKFDTASIYEIEKCLSLGIPATDLSFGNTVKKQSHIARAFGVGVNMFAFDSEAELDKLAAAAPGADVYCRFLMSGAGADWPLSQKFGCDSTFSPDLLARAKSQGLNPRGVSFHVGSQQRDLGQWDVAIGRAAAVFERCAAMGVTLDMINLGGGFPAQYRASIAPVEAHAEAIEAAMARYFGDTRPRTLVEPGRSMAGDAGIIQAEVVLISRKTAAHDARRWVYLDIGKFGGLAESMGEAIQYRICTPHDGEPTGPVVLAGPTCDEVDVLYDKAGYEMPLTLEVGDRIEFLSAGAYTSAYSSVGFNGFPPLREYYI